MIWYVEEGIGEHRAICVANGEIVAAKLDWPGGLAAGQVADGVLVSRAAGSKRGTMRFAGGEEALVDSLPREASEGERLRVRITRAALAETGRFKRAHCRPTDTLPCPAPTLAETLEQVGESVDVVHAFPVSGWDEIVADAWSGMLEFDGGTAVFSPTPAMTVIDIDGPLPPRALALAAAGPVAAAIRRFDLAGSIGIDFPTLERKEDRRAVDEALERALQSWPHERTAMNGFGFVQLVARLERPSLVQRFAADRAGAAARLLLRRAERVGDPGALLLTVHPAVRMAMQLGWQDELSRRTGRDIRWQVDPGLAPDAGFAQAIER